MPKRTYDLSFGKDANFSNKDKKPKLDDNDKPGKVVIDMGLGDVGDCVSIKDNHIYFYGNVNTKNCLNINLAIKEVGRKMTLVSYDMNIEPEHLKIYLHINSFGGSVFAAISTIDTIKSSKIPVVSIVEGGAASAATLMSCVCSERYIRPNSFMLIHQVSSGFWGTMEEIKDEFKNLKKLMKFIKKLYKKHSKLDNSEDSEVQLDSILKRDIWWDSSECLKYGLVDEIKEN